MRAIYLVISVVAGSALLGCTPASEEEEREPEWSIETARILYTARRGGVSDLYVLDRTTGQNRRLTELGTEEGGANAAAVSPSGDRLAFQVRRGSDYEIHVMDLDGGAIRNVTQHAEYDVNPTWSPDGRQLAFMSTRGFELGSLGPFPGHIYVLDLESDSLSRVSREPLTSSLGPSDWSSDGASILMARVAGGGPDIYELDVEGGQEARITDGAEGEYGATYSRQGDRIAFHAETEAGSHIVVLRLDTRERRVVSSGPGYRYSPKWSPNDEWLLFTASEDGDDYGVRAVRVDDGAVVTLVDTPDDEREGRWLEVGR